MTRESRDLQAGPVTLLQIFKGEREYVSPLFQRQYVWTNKEIEQLWRDIDEIIDGTESTRFLGAIVLEVKTSGLAFQPDSSWIVDGQQRLTTLYMILLRIALEAERADDRELFGSLYNQYIFNQDGKFKYCPKLIPTLLDHQQFRELFTEVKEVVPKLKTPFGTETGPLQKGAKVIMRYVRERCYADGSYAPEKAKQLVSTILQKLKFVQIVLGDQQDPHQVFDSLNAQGVRLENKDLIRNIVFQKLADDADKANALYNSQWLPLESELGERFDSYFFPFALVGKPSVTKSSLVAELKEKWSSWEPDRIMADLRTHVPTFNALTSSNPEARESLTASNKINQRITRLYRMPVPSTLFPFLFNLIRAYLDGKIDERTVERNLLQTESFLVRRAIAGFEPTGLHALFKDLWNKTKGDPDAFVVEIDKNPTIQFPEDEQFKADIYAKPLYGRRLARYVLEEYERGLNSGDPYPGVDLTIDHVMPQEMSEVWRSIVSEEDHKKLKDTWANLVPLSGPANAEKGQKPWPEVRQYFLTETIFKTTKRLAQQYADWNAATITERARGLAEWASERWPKRTVA